MSRTSEHVDEHILAAYLSGRLPEGLRREIVAYLASNDEARELLIMAEDAMEVGESGDGFPLLSKRRSLLRQRGAVLPTTTKQAPVARDFHHRRDESNIWKTIAILASALLVIALILAVHLLSTSD